MANMTGTSTAPYVGVDIGGTNTRIALFESLDSPDGRIIAKFPTQERYEEQIERIVGEIVGTREGMSRVLVALSRDALRRMGGA